MMNESTKDKNSHGHSKINKAFYKTLFGNIFVNNFKIRFWDGEEASFGDGESEFSIVINEPLSKAGIISNPAIAFGEAYMNNKIDIDGNLQHVIELIYNNEKSFLRHRDNDNILIETMRSNVKKNRENISSHYDIGNEFYKLWLDKTMTYSCGYFKSPEDTLEEAQINKVNHILGKLSIKEGHTLLDIGCGWGQLIIAAAKKYNIKTMGITLSLEQYKATQNRIREEGLEKLVEVKLADYRELKDMKFDRIVSVGMIEHVGKGHLWEYFSAVDKMLEDGGVSLVQSITGIKEGGRDPWIDKYIFPGGYMPGIKELVCNIAEEQFYLIDVESLRRHYVRTVESWASNFEDRVPLLRSKMDETFIRMWRLYLNASAAAFNTGTIDVHQILFSKGIANDLPWTRAHMYKNEY